jgi:pimeloyl-ACP methyl ester carboxylesterase
VLHFRVPTSSAHRVERIAGGVAVHVWRERRSRDEARPVLMAFHGRTDSGEVFSVMAERLTHVYDIVAHDAPGHGLTAWSGDGPRGYPALVPAALSTIDALGDLVGRYQGVVLLGHSMGVHAASCVAAARPDLVEHVVLEAPPTRPVFAAREVRWAVGGLRKLQAMTHEERLEYMRGEVDWTSPREFELWSRTKSQADPELIQALGPWRHSLRSVLRPIRCPVTVLVGRGGAPWWLRLPRELVPSAARSVNVVELDALHNLRREDPDRYIRLIESLVRHPVPGGGGERGDHLGNLNPG